MVAKKAATEESIAVVQVDANFATYRLIGTQPLIFNRINEKAKRELLLPSGRKNQAEKQASLKHDPLWEYRASPYKHPGDSEPTRLYMPPTSIKAAVCTAALDMPGARKSQIGRLIWIEDRHINIYGRPMLFMTPVRMADMARTPDIRTRAILPNWAAEVTISFARPHIKDVIITRLLAAAGYTVGIGDYRQEKGKGSFGQYRLVGEDNQAEFERIVREEGREAQDEGLDLALCYDAESQDLLDWYTAERQRRETAPPSTPRRLRKKDDGADAGILPASNGESAVQ